MVERGDSQLHLLSPGELFGVMDHAAITRTGTRTNLFAQNQQQLGVFALAGQLGDERFEDDAKIASMCPPAIPGASVPLLAPRPEGPGHGASRNQAASLKRSELGPGCGDLRAKSLVDPFLVPLAITHDLEAPLSIEKAREPSGVGGCQGLHLTRSIPLGPDNPEYAEMAERRIKPHRDQTTLAVDAA